MSESNFAKRIRSITYDWDEHWGYDTSDPDKKIFLSQTHPDSATNSKNSMFYGKINWDVFLYAMAIGRNEGLRKPFSSKGPTLPIDALKPRHLYSIIGLIFSLGNQKNEEKVEIDILKRPKEIRKICEEYANGGLERLIEFHKQRDPTAPLEVYENEFLKFIES